MSYQVNGKNLSVARLMVRGKEADKRMKYIHVGAKGTSVVTPVVVARVSLPQSTLGFHQSFGSAVIPQDKVDALPRTTPESTTIIELPEGEPAITGPHYLVPQIDKMFPAPEFTTATFTCNGDVLRKLLTVACEVSNDSDKTIRLRICGDMNTLRLDTYRHPGDQEFCGVLKGIDYDGDYIPGEKAGGGSKIEKRPQQTGMLLKVSTGRKFRGAGE